MRAAQRLLPAWDTTELDVQSDSDCHCQKMARSGSLLECELWRVSRI